MAQIKLLYDHVLCTVLCAQLISTSCYIELQVNCKQQP